MRSVWPGKAFDRRPSPGAGRLTAAPYDLALFSLPRHRQPHSLHAPIHAAASLELWREQHPKGYEQAIMSFEETGIVAIPVPLFASADTTSLI